MYGSSSAAPWLQQQQPTQSSLSNELFSHFLAQCRGATEALSQAETNCGQFAALARRSFASPAAVTATNISAVQQQRHPAEELIERIEGAMQRCADCCADARASSLWAVTDMATLQALSALQRQKLESMRGDVEDAERQLRILRARFAPNLTKFQSMFRRNGTGEVNYVGQVLQQPPAAKGRPGAPHDDQETEAALRSKERESIQRVALGVKNLVSESNAVLSALRQQREKVEGTESKLGQVLTAAGVAQSVIRQLERMTVIDRIIVFGGIAGLLLLMFYLWFML